MANNKPPEALHSSKSIHLKVFFYQKQHKQHGLLPQQLRSYLKFKFCFILVHANLIVSLFTIYEFSSYGSGGREHAICHKLKQSKRIKKLVCRPGNAGTKNIAENVNVDILTFDEIYKTIKNHNIDIVIIGPEQPLTDGITDYLKKRSVRVFGPNKFASQLEGSKAFTKNLCKKNNIPTANYGVFDNLNEAKDFIKKNEIPIVVKADGLAAGKGVTVCESADKAIKAIKEILEGKFKSSKKVILEKFLEGEELSYFVIVDKNSYHFFGSAQDHKRVGEGDTGPNTGGMGAYSPARLLNDELEEKNKKKL